MHTLRNYIDVQGIKPTKENICQIKRNILFSLSESSEFDNDYILKLSKHQKNKTLIFFEEKSGESFIPKISDIIACCMFQSIQNTKKQRSYIIPIMIVRKDKRGRGIGTSCLQKVISYLHSISKDKRLQICLYSFSSSRLFYEKNGFETAPQESLPLFSKLHKLEQQTEINTDLCLRFIL